MGDFAQLPVNLHQDGSVSMPFQWATLPNSLSTLFYNNEEGLVSMGDFAQLPVNNCQGSQGKKVSMGDFAQLPVNGVCGWW